MGRRPGGARFPNRNAANVADAAAVCLTDCYRRAIRPPVLSRRRGRSKSPIAGMIATRRAGARSLPDRGRWMLPGCVVAPPWRPAKADRVATATGPAQHFRRPAALRPGTPPTPARTACQAGGDRRRARCPELVGGRGAAGRTSFSFLVLLRRCLASLWNPSSERTSIAGADLLLRVSKQYTTACARSRLGGRSNELAESPAAIEDLFEFPHAGFGGVPQPLLHGRDQAFGQEHDR